ncbi:MAG TPA: AMP-binding protein [Polyangiaceae bacterium]|nr:AMP-binding protein [Polyangiaceae bacterium]
MGGAIWQPGEVSKTNLGRFMAHTNVATFRDLLARSIAEPEWFWGEATRFLGIQWFAPYERVLDASRGFPFAKWFVGGKTNLAATCVDQHAETHPERVAIVWEGEDGATRSLTYRDLRRETDALARTLGARGIGVGDKVGIFMPMVPETAAAFLAIAKIGAVALPIFSGYAAEAVAIRLADAGAKAVITVDGCYRRGKVIDLVKVAERALAAAPSVHTIVVVPRMRDTVAVTSDAIVAWPSSDLGPLASVSVDSEHPLFIAYTSGTTGRPKGSVHVHAGFLAKIAAEVAFQFDVTAGDRLFWFADMGWIMGPWEVVGTLALGATLAMYEGVPDYPAPDRLWAFLERHEVSILGISPTLVRSLMPYGEAPVRSHDLSRLRVLGSTGEPWNEDPWRWYFEVVGQKRCPVINISGGTEVGACFLSPHPVEPIKPMSLGGPALGMAVDVFDDAGNPLRGEVGELVCTRPWPGMTRGLYKDDARYLETYFGRFPNVWVHGDWASIDADGNWFLHGRSDDTIKIAGKRLGPAEVESALVSHEAVVEAAAVGVPDELKGEALWAFVVLAPSVNADETLRAELVDLVAARVGSSFRPSAVRFATALPKTRSAKVLRRAIRAVALGKPAGDLSSLEDPASLEAIRNAT